MGEPRISVDARGRQQPLPPALALLSLVLGLNLLADGLREESLKD